MTLHNVMGLKEPTEDNTEAYNKFFTRYYKTQLFQNFFFNILSSLKGSFETKNNYDWNKNFPFEYFRVPYKQNNSIEEKEKNKIESFKKMVKNEVNITKDYYFLQEEMGVLELLELFSSFEVYLKDAYEILAKNRNEFVISELEISNKNQEKIFKLINDNGRIDWEDFEDIFSDSLEKHLKEVFFNKSITEILKDLVSYLSDDIRGDFYKKISSYDDVIKKIENMREMRNLHTHNLGMENGKYQKVSGLYNIEEYRKTILDLIPVLDECIKRFISK